MIFFFLIGYQTKPVEQNQTNFSLEILSILVVKIFDDIWKKSLSEKTDTIIYF